MEKNIPLISVIIANFNGERFIINCLKSVFEEDSDNYKVIIVDDASDDKSVKLIEENFAKENRLKLIKLPKNVGAATARNIGVVNSRGDYLFFLDSDTKVAPGWSKSILFFFKKNKQAGLAQVKLLKKGTNNFDYAGDCIGPFGFLIERARGVIDHGQYDRFDKIFSGKSAGMLAHRHVFSKLGGFDCDYHIFWEDTDIMWRAWLAGFEVLFAYNISVYHAYGTEKKDQSFYLKNKVYYRGCKNMLTTMIKNLALKRLIYMLPLNIICWFILSLIFLIRGDFVKSVDILKGIIWNMLRIKSTLKKRKAIQSSRKISDDKLFAVVGANRSISYYLGKGLSYIRGKPF